MCRSVADVRTVLEIIAGPDGIDPDAQRALPSHSQSKGRLRVLVHEDSDVKPTPDIEDTLRRGADLLADAGHSLETGDALRPHRSLDITQRYWDRPLPTGQDHEQLLEDWQTFRRDVFHQMADQDVILSPTAPYAAPRVGMSSDADWAYTLAPSLWGYPAAVFRFGTSHNGLPIGLQVVAKAWGEDLVLAVAETLESMTGNWPTSLDLAQSNRP
jgi:amidase